MDKNIYRCSSVQEMLDELGVTEEELKKLGLWGEYQQTVKKENDLDNCNCSANIKQIYAAVGDPLIRLGESAHLVQETKKLTIQARDSTQQSTLEINVAQENAENLLQRERLRGIPINQKNPQ